MLLQRELLDQLALLLEYPYDHKAHETDQCRKLSKDIYPEITTEITKFFTQIKDLTTEELQELFITTFDINPVCALEVGWQLFGEHYTRGEFMAWVRCELKSHGVAEMKELPDHLTSILKLIGRMDVERGVKLITDYVLPAVTKMLDGFEDKDNPYICLLTGIKMLLQELKEKIPEGAIK